MMLPIFHGLRKYIMQEFYGELKEEHVSSARALNLLESCSASEC